MKDKVLYAALSAIANNTILPYNNFSGNNRFIPRDGYCEINLLDEISLNQSHLVGGRVPTNNINDNDGQSRIPWRKNSDVLIGLDYKNNHKKFERANFFRRNCVFVKTLTGKTITVDVDFNETINQLKKEWNLLQLLYRQKLIFVDLAECLQ